MFIKTFEFSQADIDASHDIDSLIEQAMVEGAPSAVLQDTDWACDALDPDDFLVEGADDGPTLVDELDAVPGWRRVVRSLEG